MTEDNAQSTPATAAEASAKKGGTQFIIKMIFLGLVVLAIVFYVRSLEHQTNATATPSPEAPAPIAAEEPPPDIVETPASSSTGTAAVAPAEQAEPARPTPPPRAEETAATEASETAAADEPAAQETAAADEPAAVGAEVASGAAAQAETEPHFRPLSEEEVMRQIQEVFAPETLEPAAGN